MPAEIDILSGLAGDEAIDVWLAVEGTWVEAPNERRRGLSGVQRIHSSDGRLLYRKQQAGHIYRSLEHPFGYPTAMRECDALEDCLRLGVPVPQLIFAACRKFDQTWQAVLVTEALDGFCSLEDCYLQQEELRWGEPVHLCLLEQVGEVVGRLNRGRRQHGCLYMKHIFVKVETGTAEVALIDLEKSRKRLTRRHASRHDLSQLARRAPWSGLQWQAFLKGYQAAYGIHAPVPVHG